MAGNFLIKFTSDFSQSDKAVKDFSKSTEKAFSGLKTAFAAIAAVAGTGAFFSEAIESASAQEDAINQLNIALKTTGQFSKEASEEMQAFAEELEANSTVSDEVVLSNAALIQQLGHLSGTSLKEATLAALDLSAAMQIDLESASRAVGKAAEGNIVALQKMGFEIKKGATDSETFANAMRALSDIQGAAAGKLNTFSGALKSLGNAFDNSVLEPLGNAIIKNESVIIGLNALKASFVAISPVVKLFADSLASLISDAFGLFIDLIPTAIRAIEFFNSAIVLTSSTLNGLASQFSSISSTVLGFIPGLEAEAEAYKNIAEVTQASADAAIEEGAARKAAIEQAATAAEGAIQRTREQFAERKRLAEEEDEADAERREIKDEISAEELEKEIERLEARQALLLEFGTAQAEAEIAQNKAKLDALHAQENENSNRLLKFKKEEAKKHDQIRKEQAANVKSSLEFISTLQREKSKELFFIGKAAAISVAIIDGIAAVQKALNTPFPLNITLPPLVATAAAANVARIASTQPPGLQAGIDSVPGFGSQDNFPAILAPGERVVPSETNKDLKEFLANNEGTNSLLSSIDAKLSVLSQTVVVNIGDRNIATIVRDALSDGRMVTV